MAMNSLSIIIPAYNNTWTITQILGKIRDDSLSNFRVKEIALFVAFLFWVFLIKIFIQPQQNIFGIFLHHAK